MKLKPVQLLIVAAALFAGWQVWKRQNAAATGADGEAAASQGFGAMFESLFGGGATAPGNPAATVPAETAAAADNGT